MLMLIIMHRTGKVARWFLKNNRHACNSRKFDGPTIYYQLVDIRRVVKFTKAYATVHMKMKFKII